MSFSEEKLSQCLLFHCFSSPGTTCFEKYYIGNPYLSLYKLFFLAGIQLKFNRYLPTSSSFILSLFNTLTHISTCQLKCSQSSHKIVPKGNAEKLTAFQGNTQHSKRKLLQVLFYRGPINIIMMTTSYQRACHRKIISLPL